MFNDDVATYEAPACPIAFASLWAAGEVFDDVWRQSWTSESWPAIWSGGHQKSKSIQILLC